MSSHRVNFIFDLKRKISVLWKKEVYLCLLGFMLFLPNLAYLQQGAPNSREGMEQEQNRMAFDAYAKGDWLTLIHLARMAHDQKQDILWERGLMDWAQELVLYRHIVAGAFHLGAYYKDIGDWAKENYWYRIGQEWEKKRRASG